MVEFVALVSLQSASRLHNNRTSCVSEFGRFRSEQFWCEIVEYLQFQRVFSRKSGCAVWIDKRSRYFRSSSGGSMSSQPPDRRLTLGSRWRRKDPLLTHNPASTHYLMLATLAHIRCRLGTGFNRFGHRRARGRQFSVGR